MADEKHEGGDPVKDAWWIAGTILVLIVLWYFAGGPGRADLRGLFIAPPPPLGPGNSYGPQVGGSTSPEYPATDYNTVKGQDYSQVGSTTDYNTTPDYNNY